MDRQTSNTQYSSPPKEPVQASRSGAGVILADIMTAIFLLATVMVISLTVLIINDPAVPFNPFPKDPTVTPFMTPTQTPTLLPSPTPSATATLTPSVTPLPTAISSPTPLPTLTPTAVLPGSLPIATFTLTPTATLDPDAPRTGDDDTPIPGVILQTSTSIPTLVESEFPFIAEDIRYQANANTQGCQWLSIAGNVTGPNDEPITDLAIEIIGNDVEAVVFSGSAPDFGLSGFEAQVGYRPERSEFSVRLLNATGVPISDFVTFYTGESCERNVAIIEFKQIRSY